MSGNDDTISKRGGLRLHVALGLLISIPLVHSDGDGKGSTFTLQLPCENN